MAGYEEFFKKAKVARKQRPSESDAVKKQNSRRQILAQQKARRTQETKTRRERAQFPIGIFIFAMVSVALAAFAMTPGNLEWLVDQTDYIDIQLFGGAMAASDKQSAADKSTAEKHGAEKPAADKSASNTTSVAEKNSEHKDKSADHEENVSQNSADKKSDLPVDVRNWSDEEISFINKLTERKKALDLRESELKRLEEELHKQKVELDTKMKKLEAIRAEISQTLKSRVQEDQERVGKLVEVYSAMKPQQAAKVIESLNVELAVAILDRMKKKSASEILNVMDAKRARQLSELLAGYRSPANEEAKESKDMNESPVKPNTDKEA